MDVGAPLSTTNINGTWRWNSPLPYLFGGLAAMLGLISFALLILACTYHKSMDDDDDDNLSSPDDVDEEKPAKLPTLPPAEFEPKIVVIMAGNDQPTYLAKPVSVIHDAQQRVLSYQ
ncbi:Glutamine dumper, partial [Thalictrum thalictroides]